MASSQVEIAYSSPFGCPKEPHPEGTMHRDQCESCVRLGHQFQRFGQGSYQWLHLSLSSAANSQNKMTHVATSTNEQSNIGNHRNLHTTNIKNGERFPITPKHSPLVLDRWVTRQAQDVTIDKHVVNKGAGQLLVPTNSNTASPMASNLSTPLENAMVKHNLGASSLVQIWEARLHRSYQGQSMGSDTSRTNPGSSTNENNINASSVEEASTLDEKIENRRNNDPEDSLIDCDTSAPPFCSSCDAGERERVRVADIIKRLKNGREDADDDERINTNVTDSQSRENKHSSTSDQGKAGRRYFLRIASSPRLRGRQAFYDLLMQIERDKNRELDSLMERRSVSKFSQRGRLQSMLRLRCLQRSLTIQDKCHPQGPEVHGTRFSHGSTMMQAREKFSTGSNCQQNLFLDSQETAENVNPYSQNETAEERDNHQQHLSLGLEETTETSLNEIGEERELEQDIDDKQQLHHDSQENAGKATFYSDNDGSEEVLNTISKNEEIRQLLERGRVSTCLASDFRERMDRLMNSRVQIMQEDGGASQEEADDEDRMVQVKSYLQRHLHPADGKETGNYSDRGPSTFSTPSGVSEAQYYQDTRQSSCSIAPTSLMKFQQYSFNRELLHSGGREENKPTERVASPWKCCCCICLKVQVDSLLYSCGHMCTCLKYAHELQWSSGKCPKCTAPILDVVPIK
ncbi:hypothetical protein GOBAR_AA31247 [Gossypium barbadense]|uniref:RING-type domain-containing protein n=1 Tax=Gossypium barbadense TaxID=3634 RepID=A0A2P5WEE5_GOSBA|nr:hypothetical protein GOBAR_AA31247 [Gossypium barbadense]